MDFNANDVQQVSDQYRSVLNAIEKAGRSGKVHYSGPSTNYGFRAATMYEVETALDLSPTFQVKGDTLVVTNRRNAMKLRVLIDDLA